MDLADEPRLLPWHLKLVLDLVLPHTSKHLHACSDTELHTFLKDFNPRANGHMSRYSTVLELTISFVRAASLQMFDLIIQHLLPLPQSLRSAEETPLPEPLGTQPAQKKTIPMLHHGQAVKNYAPSRESTAIRGIQLP